MEKGFLDFSWCHQFLLRLSPPMCESWHGLSQRTSGKGGAGHQCFFFIYALPGLMMYSISLRVAIGFVLGQGQPSDRVSNSEPTRISNRGFVCLMAALLIHSHSQRLGFHIYHGFTSPLIFLLFLVPLETPW